MLNLSGIRSSDPIWSQHAGNAQPSWLMDMLEDPAHPYPFYLCLNFLPTDFRNINRTWHLQHGPPPVGALSVIGLWPYRGNLRLYLISRKVFPLQRYLHTIQSYLQKHHIGNRILPQTGIFSRFESILRNYFTTYLYWIQFLNYSNH